MERYQNSTVAFVNKLAEILDLGDEVVSRGSLTKELTGVSFQILAPMERCYILPHRNDNIFHKIAETLWVLAGRNDADWLVRYLPRALDYSDDGKTWRAAYGARLRNYGEYYDDGANLIPGVDQLQNCIRILKDDKFSRRAVMSIFDPTKDYEASKDIPCLSGDTILESPEATKTLEQLAKEFANGSITRYPIYVFNTRSKQMRLTWCNRVWKSGIKKVMRVHFDDGTYVTCTPDHKFFTKLFRNKEYCEVIHASDLKVNDRVWATQLWPDAKGYLTHKLNLSKNTAKSNMQKIHIEYYSLANDCSTLGMVVHHMDDVKTHNAIGNLQQMTISEHNSHHRIINNPMHTMSAEEHAQRASKQSASLKEYWKHAGDDRHNQQREIGKRRIHGTDGKFTANHKIIAIENLHDAIDVYDFEVPEYHNAMLDNGVFVHNCNNWIHWMIRDHMDYQTEQTYSQIDMYVTQRSSDILWGFSGINTFEWSVLHMCMAHWLGVVPGTLTYNISSLHLYEPHFKRARSIVDSFKGYTVYMFGAEHASGFSTSFEDLDDVLREAFASESYLRQNRDAPRSKDKFIDNCLHMLYIYNKMLDGLQDEAAQGIVTLPDNDFKLAAVYYYEHKYGMRLHDTIGMPTYMVDAYRHVFSV